MEANKLTVEMLISQNIWDKEKDDLIFTNRDSKIISFANQLEISPAIVAGRIRWETENYTIFNQLVGNKTVKKLFTSQS